MKIGQNLSEHTPEPCKTVKSIKLKASCDPVYENFYSRHSTEV